MESKPKKAELLKPRTIKMQPRNYQPKKAEKEQEIDMPGASEETVRSAFFRPVECDPETN